MNWYLRALAFLLICSAVAEIAWKEGRGKTYDETLAAHQARNDLRARIEVDSRQLERTKAADDSLILAQQDALERLATQLENLKCN